MRKKVYCNGCNNFSYLINYGCDIVKKLVDTPLSPRNIHFDYKKLNKNNNCKYYKKRQYKKEVPKMKKWYQFWE